MKEIKLTDEEIVKALEVCFNTPFCTNECPYFNKNGRNFCMERNALYNDLKDLINRLQAENEKLRGAKVIYETVDYCAEDLKKAQKEIERLTDFEAKAKCEIERLSKNETENLKTVKNLKKQVDELKEQLLIAKLQGLTEGYNNGVQAERNAQIFKPTVVELPKEITEQIQRQAVKDTAKEILEWLLDNAYVNKCIDLHVNEVKAKFRVRYGVEVE